MCCSAAVSEPCWPGMVLICGSARERMTEAAQRSATTTSPIRDRAAAELTGPNQPSAIACSPVTTQAREPSRSVHAASTSGTAPGSAYTCW
jgi:hypothetical protein